MSAERMPAEPADDGPRMLKCRGGPLDGERQAVPPGATEIAVPLPGTAPVAAVYRVQHRRRGRGVGYLVLVYVRNQCMRGGG